MLDIDFADREYELGGSIDVSIIVTPDRDTTIRSAQVDLVCNQTYTHHSEWEGTVSNSATNVRASAMQARYGAVNRPIVEFAGGSKVDQRTETYVHSTVTTLKDTLFRAGVTETRRVDLRISPTTPKRLREATEAHRNASAAWSFAWTLSVSLDIARGRDLEVEREVRIKLPPLPAGTSSAKPSMSRPKRPTGPKGPTG